jgi:hypothetical protein
MEEQVTLLRFVVAQKAHSIKEMENEGALCLIRSSTWFALYAVRLWYGRKPAMPTGCLENPQVAHIS